MTTIKSAVVSSCYSYRYQLERRTTKKAVKKSAIVFIGLYLSTADATTDDPTIRMCMAFAIDWQFNTLIMVNLFAWRATDPSELFKVEDLVGIDNDHYIDDAASRASMVVACWGENDRLHNRSDKLRARYPHRLHGLKVNRSGQPSHPLYLPKSLVPLKLNWQT